MRASSNRFHSEARFLLTGSSIDSALGINRFMKVSDSAVYSGMAEGLPAIAREIELQARGGGSGSDPDQLGVRI